MEAGIQFISDYGFATAFYLAIVLALATRRRVYLDLWAYLSAGVLAVEIYLKSYSCTGTDGIGDLAPVLCSFDWFSAVYNIEVVAGYLLISVVLTAYYYSQSEGDSR